MSGIFDFRPRVETRHRVHVNPCTLYLGTTRATLAEHDWEDIER